MGRNGWANGDGCARRPNQLSERGTDLPDGLTPARRTSLPRGARLRARPAAEIPEFLRGTLLPAWRRYFPSSSTQRRQPSEGERAVEIERTPTGADGPASACADLPPRRTLAHEMRGRGATGGGAKVSCDLASCRSPRAVESLTHGGARSRRHHGDGRLPPYVIFSCSTTTASRSRSRPRSGLAPERPGPARGRAALPRLPSPLPSGAASSAPPPVGAGCHGLLADERAWARRSRSSPCATRRSTAAEPRGLPASVGPDLERRRTASLEKVVPVPPAPQSRARRCGRPEVGPAGDDACEQART